MTTATVTRGSTAEFVFNLDVSVSDLQIVEIYLVQNNTIIKKWELADCTTTDTSLTVPVTQANTLALVTTEKAKVQLRVKTTDSDVMVSRTFPIAVLPYIGTEEAI